MPRPHRNARVFAFAAVLAIGGVACGSAKPTPTPSHSATSRPSTPVPATPTPAPPPPPPALAAPWIIQVENLSDARPQSGLSAADIVYEYETEGGISRFSTIFFSVPAPTVGPVRSARLVTIKLMDLYRANLLYSGASATVEQTFSYDTQTHAYNEGSSNGALFRVGTRVAPHNLYTDGNHIGPFAASLPPRTVSYQGLARTPDNALPPGGLPGLKFSVPVSDSEQPIYTYDPTTRGYAREEPDTGVLIDNDTTKDWEPKNILVLPVSVNVAPGDIESGCCTLGLDFQINTSGTGQLAVGGAIYPVNFNEQNGPPQLTLANGQPAPIVPGQVLIELVKTGRGIQQ